MTRSRSASPRGVALLGSALALGALALLAALESRAPAAYYRLLQEDEVVEWITFWTFLGAAALFAFAARGQWRAERRVPWFLLGVALFCFVVGMEEISWGQRLLGFRPPAYFLAHNFQQELNIHNVIETAWRKRALRWTLGGYGLLLPGLALVPALRRRLEGLAVVAPPVDLAPAFLAALVLYNLYPWTFTGEIVELLMGIGFLFAGLAARDRFAAAAASAPLRRRLAAGAVVAAGVASLGWATTALTQWAARSDPARVEEARREAESLKLDLLSLARQGGGEPVTRCGLHKRLFTYVESYRMDPLRVGQFSRLTSQGLPEERARFFLDPWNSPYWIRDRCADGGRRRAVFVYSFGPNRRRDSTPWEIGGDDVGAVVLRRGT